MCVDASKPMTCRFGVDESRDNPDHHGLLLRISDSYYILRGLLWKPMIQGSKKKVVRSSIFKEGDDIYWRKYHDTSLWVEINPRRNNTELRGVSVTNKNHTPDHLHNALRVIFQKPETIHEFVRMYGTIKSIKVSTAWCYVTRAVEEWPKAHINARALVFPGLMSALISLQDRSGRLVDLMQRLNTECPELTGDFEWRSCDDRYAHLRLARVCLDAADLVRGHL